MSRVLLDENMPVGLGQLLTEHDVAHTARLGLQGIKNGDLIRKAESAGFDVMVTADKSIRYQQNLTGRQIALVIVSIGKWATVRADPDPIRKAVHDARPGTFQDVEVGRRNPSRDRVQES